MKYYKLGGVRTTEIYSSVPEAGKFRAVVWADELSGEDLLAHGGPSSRCVLMWREGAGGPGSPLKEHSSLP